MILITMLKWCRSRRLIHENPLDGYKLIKPHRKVGAFVIHSLRHFFLTCCLNARVPKYMVDFWVGHTGDQSVGKLYYGLAGQRRRHSYHHEQGALRKQGQNRDKWLPGWKRCVASAMFPGHCDVVFA